MARSEQIYLGRQNRLVRELTRAGQPLGPADKAAITRVTAHIGPVCLDSADPAHPITYADGVVTMQPGLVDGLPIGETECHLAIHDPGNEPHGLAWGSFPVEVVDWPKCEVAP